MEAGGERKAGREGGRKGEKQGGKAKEMRRKGIEGNGEWQQEGRKWGLEIGKK